MMLSRKESCIWHAIFMNLKKKKKKVNNIVFRDTQICRKKKILSQDTINTKIQDSDHLWERALRDGGG